MVAGDALAIDRHDARTLLSAVLQGVQAEIGDLAASGTPETPMIPHIAYAPTDRSTSGCRIRRGIASK